jgi:hypothetical protein
MVISASVMAKHDSGDRDARCRQEQAPDWFDLAKSKQTRPAFYSTGMSTDPDAAGSARRATDKGNELPVGLEAAWGAWIKGLQGIDEQAQPSPRAAFWEEAAAWRTHA